MPASSNACPRTPAWYAKPPEATRPAWSKRSGRLKSLLLSSCPNACASMRSHWGFWPKPILSTRACLAVTRAPAPTPLRLYQPLSQAADQLRELLRARDELIEQIKIEANHAEHPSKHPLLAKQAAKRHHLFDQQLEQIQAAIKTLVAADPSLHQRSERVQQIQSIGPVSAWTILAEMPELGSLKKGQPSCLLGVAPFCQDSGSTSAQRHISGGRPRARRVLYMAAVSAAQHNPILKPFYQRLRSKGKSPKIALVAVMRKLVELINLTLKYPNCLFSPRLCVSA
ncbi:IS110 family transposase [Opitutaceae bacterium TAV3]|nr:IS110 family transposase [Opitutaceae bacterium TAV3]